MPSPHPTAWTLASLAECILPGWSFPDDWLFWPPDLFALTSLVLRRTGCYRYIISGEWTREEGWQGGVERCAELWLEGVSGLLAGESGRGAPLGQQDPRQPLLADAVTAIRELAPAVTLEELRVLETERSRALCRALVSAHCIADETCTGFGLLSSPRPEHALAHCLANLLLTATGSLSVIPKHEGIVLPKMRTPQSGLTLRSLSHHMSYHCSEVEVMWRTVPWANIEENTINILSIPWPATVCEDSIHPLRETFESVRYFLYDPPPPADGDRLARVVELVQRVNREVGRLHMLVFPELALTKKEYEQLMWLLREARMGKRIQHVPIIISGLLNRDRQFGDLNEVRLAVYFADRWYELSQRKHHRWKLNRSQILQYSLEGRLSTTRNWYERIGIAQRRLTFLAPSGWLALCPLICEDLAQLDPVSDLIRGVGPTLLAALLMDGPQLKDRWSARYASVFADDPGTAVLTLTSAGMAERSRALGVPESDGSPRRTVALWKDQIAGWKILDLKETCEALLLTISADWTEEYTVDGRGDHQNAAVFKFEGVRQYVFPSELDLPAGGGSGTAAPPPEPADEPGERIWLGDWADIRELSAATYALDAVIELEGRHVETITCWLLGRPAQGEESLPPPLSHLVGLLRTAQRDPRTMGIEAVDRPWPTPPLEWAASEIVSWFEDHAPGSRTQAEYWSWLVGEANRRLESEPALDESRGEADRQRIRRAVPIAVLCAIHSRIERRRKRRPWPHGGGRAARDDLTWCFLVETLEKIEDSLRAYA